jgi:GNAT superfamily N-acetyltransferase
MRSETLARVDEWWADLLGIDATSAWQTSTLTWPHARLGDFSGWFVAWRHDGDSGAHGVHVSAPAVAARADLDVVSAASPETLQSVGFWAELAQRTGGTLRGPSVHHYLDRDPGFPESATVAVEQVDPVRLSLLRDHVRPAEWDESGLDDLAEDGGVALAAWGEPGRPPSTWVPALRGAAVLTDHAGAPRDIGLLVAEDMRGSGVGAALGRAAASYAIGWHGWARWTARADNGVSMRLAQRLGFEPYVDQLAITPPETT